MEACGEAWTEPGNLVSNGPFRLASWIPGKRIAFVRNAKHHGHFAGNVDRIEWIPDAPGPTSVGLALYEGDASDVVKVGLLRPTERTQARQRHAEEYLARPQSKRA